MRCTKVLAALLLTVSAFGCSNDSGGTSTEVSADGKPYVEALTKSFTSKAEGNMTLEQAQAECISAKWINVITPERLKKAGIDPAVLATSDGTDRLSETGLDKDQAGTMVDGFDECDVNIRDVFLKTLREDKNSTEAAKKCVANQINDDLIRQLLIESLTSSPTELENSPLAGQFLAVMMSCAGGDLTSSGG